MLLLRLTANFAGLLMLALGLGACSPQAGHVAEEQDPHFQRGVALVNSEDYKGAIDEFDKALEDNPHSSAAHFELGCLYDKLNDWAAAIYHYQQHLKRHSNSDQTQLVQDRIRGCKEELAHSEFAPPDTVHLQREVDRLTAENLALKEQLTAWQRAAEGRRTPLPVSPPMPSPAEIPAPSANPPPSPIATMAVAPAVSSRPRIHIVKQRETISSIAVEYGVKASAVLAANPRVDPRRLRVGQSLTLP